MVVKAAVSGVVIVTGTVIANRLSPSLGGWVAAFPTIGFLTVSWLWFDGGSGSEATGLFVEVARRPRQLGRLYAQGGRRSSTRIRVPALTPRFTRSISYTSYTIKVNK